ncbi:symmetrical bis(5'-nucleosyl)-tetraphosphatase [Celerinatantimonas sp. MCCC 1A17872]|uniref:symmetrical bis(5'-nucleosyl)-tetraphosphatase n=1 Tax=Celerinatantimonas sp. MCCC 1A17872 TaxID=3177514 RepID=UPI0038C3566E
MHYMIGDLHGCYDELRQLLEIADINLDDNQFWFTGDLIGRGNQPLETLRFIRSLGKNAQVVLGNHDLHFLAVADGVAKLKAKDKVDALLSAPDSEELIDWLWRQPLLAQLDRQTVMVHAGITPQWSLEKALACADEIHNLFVQPQLRHELLTHMYGDEPNLWDDNLEGSERYRFIINSFTRMRFCYSDLSLDFAYKEGLENAPKGLTPWYKLRNDQTTIIFGHWAALMGKVDNPQVKAMDTGCIWGNQLSMLEWETGQLYQTQCEAYRRSN